MRHAFTVDVEDWYQGIPVGPDVRSSAQRRLDRGLGALLDHLERKGWVERRPDSRDRRVKRVHLTPKVDPIMAFVNEVGATLNRQALAGLAADEQNRLIDNLLAVKANLLQIPPQPGAE